MAIRFLDGFDSYPTADIGLKWSYSQNIAIAASGGRFGSGALSLNSGGNGYAQKVLDNQQVWTMGAAVSFPGLPSSGNLYTFFQMLDGTSTQVELNINPLGKLVVTRSGTTIATGTTVLAINTFYYIEFQATIAGGTSGSVAVHISGSSELSTSGLNTSATSNAYASVIRLAYTQNGSTCYMDDFYCCDGTGSTNNTFLGDVRVETLYPAANGTVTQFTPSSGSNYSCVDEHPENGDTSYVAADVIGDEDTYTFGSLSSTPTNIYGVQLNVVARKDDAGVRSIGAVIRHSGTDYSGASRGLPDSYSYLTDLRATNPATTAAWTASDISGLEAGFKVLS